MSKRLKALERKIERVQPKVIPLQFSDIYLSEADQKAKLIRQNQHLPPEVLNEYLSKRVWLSDMYPSEAETERLNRAHRELMNG